MFVYFINVPLNKDGMNEFELYEDEMPNVKTFELTEEDYNVLRKPNGLFSKIDGEVGTIIDICEEERIEIENIPKAIAIVKKYKSKDENEKNACKIVLESLQLAYESQTFWEIDIYLK